MSDILCDFSHFHDVFNGEVGKLPAIVRLTVKADAKPIVRPLKRLPLKLRDAVKQELDRLINLGALVPVDEPTDPLTG